MSGTIHIRDATPSDAPAVAAIYGHHVLHGTASYDTEPPTAEDRARKIAEVQARGWPFLVAEADGTVAGYAFATQFRDRPAYAFACENSVYVHPDFLRRGIGQQLVAELIERAARCGFRQMVAVIGGPEEASVRLHAACGFENAGRLTGMGWKKGRWLDNVYMQRPLGPGSSEPPDVLS